MALVHLAVHGVERLDLDRRVVMNECALGRASASMQPTLQNAQGNCAMLLPPSEVEVVRQAVPLESACAAARPGYG